jgi:glycosyltransferase involved in cell wall biosynthesis
VVTVSEYSRRDIIQFLGVPQDRVTVTYEAADRRFHQPITAEARQQVREKYRLPKQYLFYVGALEKRKNIPFLLKALAIASVPDLHVVLGGGNAQDCELLRQLAASLGIGDRVSLLGRVPDEDLPALYKEARAFVYPSEYEGFGLQICEALATGCPILVANATSLPEILGDGGDVFALDSPDQLAAMLVRLQGDADYRVDLQRRAQIRSGRFSWRDTAQRTLAVYELIRERNPATSAQPPLVAAL